MHSRRVATGCASVLLLPALAYSEEAVTPTARINGQDLSNFYTWLVDTKYQDPDRVFGVVDAIDGAPAIRISALRGLVVNRVSPVRTPAAPRTE